MSETPPGVPSAVTVTEFAAALNLKARTVRSWVDSGSLSTRPRKRNKKRLIPIEELLSYESSGWPVDWDILT